MGVQEQSYNKKVRFWDKFHGTRGARGQKWPVFELFSLQKWLFSTFYYCIFTLKSVEIEIQSPMCTNALPTSKLLIHRLNKTLRDHGDRYFQKILSEIGYCGLDPRINPLCPGRHKNGDQWGEVSTTLRQGRHSGGLELRNYTIDKFSRGTEVPQGTVYGVYDRLSIQVPRR